MAASRELEAMTRPELGTKRLCADCGAKFYDLNQAPIACPKCGAVFEAVQVSSRWRAEPAHEAGRKVEPAVAETQEAQFVSPEDADAEAQGKQRRSETPETEDEVALDDESLDDGGLIAETEDEDTDVTEIIGDDIDVKEGD